MTAPIAATDAGAWWSPQVEDYLRLRRSLGFKLAWDEHLLAKFTADLASRDVRVVTVADAVAWSAALPAGQTHRPLTRASVRLTAIRGFATYLHSMDPAHEIPPRDMFRWRKSRPAPYVYTDEQVRALLDACASMIRYGRRDLYPVLFGLIAATGLRLEEALGLGVDEVEVKNGILTITRGKSRDPRLVPLHPTTTAALRDYAERIAPPAGAAAPGPADLWAVGRGSSPCLAVGRCRRATSTMRSERSPPGSGCAPRPSGRAFTTCGIRSRSTRCSVGIATATTSPR